MSRLGAILGRLGALLEIEFHWNILSPAEKAEFRRAMATEAIHWKQYKGPCPVPISEVKTPLA